MKLYASLTATLLLTLAGAPARAELDLSRAAVSHLDNGLTLIVLEDHALPIVSFHASYKTGSKYDPAGRMGLAHFFEHMAFRQSKNFPGEGLVSSIYAVGGEWHGYTWIDNTNFYATAPRDNLDLLMRIEADRMGRLVLDKKDVKAEAGAVVAEMKGYENDPTSTLYDAVLATVFQVHPYRNNSIGYEADVRAITHADIAAYYKEHINPANAVIAVVGDVDAADVAKNAARYFGKIRSGAPTPLPPASEPAQTGERHVRLEGDTTQKLFKIAYPAPSARSDDFAAFLVLEDLAGAVSGVNFDQNDWGTPIRSTSALGGVADDVTTFFIPTAESYVLLVSGAIGPKGDEKALETSVQKRLSVLQSDVSDDAVSASRARVLKSLAFDVETTEDAAHQLAYFESIGALDEFLDLKSRVKAVTADDVMRVAQIYLDPRRRTIGWFVPRSSTLAALPKDDGALASSPDRPGAPATDGPAPAPQVKRLASGVPAIIQNSPLSPTFALEIVAPGAFTADDPGVEIRNDAPAPGYASFRVESLSENADDAIAKVAKVFRTATPAAAPGPSDNPKTELRRVFTRFIGRAATSPKKPAPLVIAASGDVDADKVFAALEKNFGAFGPAAAPAPLSGEPTSDMTVNIPAQKSQTALGYIVKAPGGADPAALAWRMTLYILTHHYGGRLGAEAISHRGLLYYIGSDYQKNADAGWITLVMGVNPDKQAPLRALLKEELARLVSQPPSEAEVAEARRHLLGRKISAAQSNDEIVDAISSDWIAYGDYQNAEALKKALDAVTREDIIKVLPAFTSGGVITIETGETPAP